MQKRTSPQAQKVLQRYRDAFYDEGNVSVRDVLYHDGTDYVIIVDVAYEGASEKRYRTLADIEAAAAEREALNEECHNAI